MRKRHNTLNDNIFRNSEYMNDVNSSVEIYIRPVLEKNLSKLNNTYTKRFYRRNEKLSFN